MSLTLHRAPWLFKIGQSNIYKYSFQFVQRLFRIRDY